MARVPDKIARMFAAGEVIAGKYRVERILGEGGMGVVVLAQHTELDQRVALKFMLVNAGLPPEALTRFQREARAVAKLRGENVARVIDVGTLDDGTAYIVMEYLEGRDLAELCSEHPLPVADAVDYVLQASVALAEAHAQGIVHRDLKPANLFLTHRPDGSPLVKVLDFGVSKLKNEDEPSALTTRTGTVMGSPLFMPPEQARSSKDVDLRADIWALGAVLYKLIAQRPPFSADNFADLMVKILHQHHEPLSSLGATIPPSIDAVIDRCLAKRPEDRYQDLGELAVALAPFASPDGARLVKSVLRLTGDPRATQPGQAPGPTDGSVPPLVERAPVADGATERALSVSTAPPQSKRPLLLAAGVGFVGVGAVALVISLRALSAAPEPLPSSAAGAEVTRTLAGFASADPASSAAPVVAPAVSATAPAASATAEPPAESAAKGKPAPRTERPVKTTKALAEKTEKPSAGPPPAEPPKAKPSDPFGTMQ